MKDFEDLPQQISYIAWNLKRIADQFERYNNQNDTKKQVPTGASDSDKLRNFINGIENKPK